MAVRKYGTAPTDYVLGNLGTALTVNGDTPDTLDRGMLRRLGLLQINSTAGTTVTVNVLGSVDGTNFWNIPYALAATPTTAAVAALTITTTTIGYYVLLDSPWRFLKVNLSAINGMTLTIDAGL